LPRPLKQDGCSGGRAYTRFLWVSRPDALHSRSLSSRPQVGIVIFDSTVPIGTALAVYIAAEAEELTGEEAERSLAIFSRRSQTVGGREWTVKEIRAPAPHRLYCARASSQFVLGRGDERIAVNLG
jgi:hypothetical protein